jgi:hypothetical protein
LHCTDIIIIENRVWLKSQEISRGIRKRLANCRKLLFVRSISVDVRNSMSETQCQRVNVRDSMSDLMSETQCQRLNVRDSISETKCQRLNVRDPMSETQCQRVNVKVGFTNLVMRLYYTSHLGVQLDIGVRRDSRFVVFSFPTLDCSKAFSECRPATHSIYVLRHLLYHRGTDIFGPVRNASRPLPWNLWWRHNDGCSVDMRVAKWI